MGSVWSVWSLLVQRGVGQELVVVPVPCLKDNYAYLVFDQRGDGECLVVDPSEAEPVRQEVERRGLRLKAILNTHHHWDHVGGNVGLLSEGPLEVIAYESDRDRIPGLTRTVTHGSATLVLGWEFRALHIPGHTSGAVAYLFGEICFTGDTLFCGGCGRLFEGTPEQMHHSLTEVLGELPDETLMYCGHEYTLANLQFAQSIWSHQALEARLLEVEARRRTGQFCASATLGVERQTNPFLLCHREELKRATQQGDELSTFAELRRKKNSY